MVENKTREILELMAKTLANIKAALAWERLKLSESHPDNPWGSTLGDDSEERLREGYSQFLSLRRDLQAILSMPRRVPLAPEERRIVIHQKGLLEWDFNGLGLHQRFIKG